MGKVSKPKLFTIPQLTAGHNRHEGVLTDMMVTIDMLWKEVSALKALAQKPASGCECKPATYTGPRFDMGEKVRFKGNIRGVDDFMVIGRCTRRNRWHYWVDSDAGGPVTYLESQLESAE